MSCSGVWRSEFRFRPSRLALFWLLSLGLLALLAIMASHAPFAVRLAATLALLAWAGWQWRRHARGADRPLRACRQIANGWRLTLADGDTAYAELHGPVRDARHLLVLCWQERQADVMPGQRSRCWRLALWADQLATDDWRRLRVSLRWRSRGPGSTARALARSTVSAPGRCPE